MAGLGLARAAVGRAPQSFVARALERIPGDLSAQHWMLAILYRFGDHPPCRRHQQYKFRGLSSTTLRLVALPQDTFDGGDA